MKLGTVGRQFGVLMLAAALAGCGGSGFGTGSGSPSSNGAAPSSPSSSGGTPGGTTKVTPANLYLNAGSPNTSSVVITATVTDANSVAIGGQTVVFSAPQSCNCTITPGSTTTASDGTITATLLAQSPGSITVTATAGSLSKSITVNIPAAPVYKLGVIDGNGNFTAGTIGLGQPQISAGGSSGLQVNIYDVSNKVAYINAATVTFNSNCISANTSVAPSVTNSVGTFDSTYTAQGCSGSDLITATATLADGSVLTASNTITVQKASLGAVIFDSADTTTTSIGLRGTGQNETAKVYFQVLDQTGSPVNGATVNFTPTTTVGGLTISPSSAKTDANGKVYTTVASGTVHTVVRIIASATSNGNTLTTQSSLLTVSTGFPAQNGFSLAATTLNIEGNDIDGIQTTITARLSDRYNNPVPDGTAVTFQAECGNVQPQCTTKNGACSVVFTSQSPRTSDLVNGGYASSYDWYQRLQTNPSAPKCLSNSDHELGCDDHRCTVLATAVGEESFTDCNGNGLYTSKDSPMNNATQCPQGDNFVSLPEAFQDNNENGVFDSTETYVDFNHNGVYDPGSGLFVGLLCNDVGCDPNQSSLNVRKSIIIVMSSSAAVIASTGGVSGQIMVEVTDTAGQVMPAGTTITAVYNNASSVVPQGASYTEVNTSTCPNTVTGCSGGAIATTYPFSYSITDVTKSATVTIYVKSPSGVTTIQTFPIA